MRNNRLFYVIVLMSSLFQACDTTKKTSEEPTEKVEENSSGQAYTFELKKLAQKLSTCTDGECTRVEVNYPVFDKTTANYQSINKTIESHVQTLLSDYIMEADGDEEVSTLINMFLLSYQKFKESFPESQTPWYVECNVVVSAITPEYLSLAFNISSYTGGAHTNTMIDYVNLSPKGKVIDDLDFFFKETDELAAIAEEQFRKKYNLTSEEPLSKNGFIFDNDSFTLTENFGFTESAVIFYYNSYDVAPYALGPTALLIPLYNLREIYQFPITNSL